MGGEDEEKRGRRRGEVRGCSSNAWDAAAAVAPHGASLSQKEKQGVVVRLTQAKEAREKKEWGRFPGTVLPILTV